MPGLSLQFSGCEALLLFIDSDGRPQNRRAASSGVSARTLLPAATI
jgi:hypothetical protein